MGKKKLTKEEALEHCMEQIKPSNLGDEYNLYRQYKVRFNKGELKDKAIRKLFDRFGIKENCYYTIEDEK